MENELITVSGVTGYIDENGTAQLNTENCARGLGFTQEKNGVEYIRWERINGYISELGFSPLLGKAFIPENLLYRLVWKADSETAKLFQAKVADEILPAIRKTGTYSVKIIDSYAIEDPIERAKTWITEREERDALDKERKALTGIIEKDKPKVLFADSVSTSKTSILIGELAKIIRQNGVEIGEKRLFEWLRQNGYLISRFGTDHNAPTQRAMELKLFEVKETIINHSSGFTTISKTTKVTGKGQQYLINKFLGESLQAM